MISRRNLLLGSLLLTGGLFPSKYRTIARAAESVSKVKSPVKNVDGQSFDVAIVGGGMAGLQAALTLGRACRKVVIFDDNKPRNSNGRSFHNFLGSDGADLNALRQRALEQLHQYDVSICNQAIKTAEKNEQGFSLTTDAGINIKSKKVIIASGLKDELPDIEGMARLWGKSILYCPYCSGWELRDKPIAVFGQGDIAAFAAMTLTGWSSKIVLLTNGDNKISDGRKQDLKKLDIEIVENKIVKVEGQNSLEAIVFADGKRLQRQAIFLQPVENHSSPVLSALGAKETEWKVPALDARGQTSVHGLYVAGDASGKAFQAIGAAADGAAVAFAVNRALIFEPLQARGIAVT